jgi:hypothetical protein
MEQETLEEAANRLFYTVGNEGISSIDSFMKGASYQAERMYSEEEVMDMFHNFSMHLPLHYEFLVKEQFKKK